MRDESREERNGTFGTVWKVRIILPSSGLDEKNFISLILSSATEAHWTFPFVLYDNDIH